MKQPKYVLVDAKKFEQLTQNVAFLMDAMKTLQKQMVSPTATCSHIAAIEFMDAVKIKRSTFDALVKKNQIKIIHKGRKIYLPKEAIQDYFSTNS